jgi:hypothetical protein
VKYQLNKRHSQSILKLESGTSYREKARKCHISKSSAVEYANLVASQKRSDNLHRVWRKRSTGLEITTNGSKELPGGRRVNVMVPIANYWKGFVLRKIDGQFFAQFITEHFHIAFPHAVPIHK